MASSTEPYFDARDVPTLRKLQGLATNMRAHDIDGSDPTQDMMKRFAFGLMADLCGEFADRVEQKGQAPR